MKNSSEQLQTFEPEALAEDRYVPVTRRIADLKSSLAINQQQIDDNDKRDRRRSLVVRHNAGNPPIPQSERKPGTRWEANIPFREHEAKCNEMAATFNDLDDRVPYIPKVSCRYTNDIEQDVNLGQQMSECYDTLLKEGWTGFTDETEEGIDEMVLFGYFAAFWPDETSYKWINLKSNQVLLPEGAQSNSEKWSMVTVRMSYTVHDLWRRISSPELTKASEAVGWDADAIKLAIMRSTNEKRKDPYQLGDWVAFEQKLIANDLHHNSLNSDPILCSHQLVKEMDGTIRRLILYEGCDVGEYLYDKKTEFKSFDRFIQITYFDVQKFFHDHRGTGEKIYNLTLMMDILGNDAVNSTRLDQTVMFKGARRNKDRKMRFDRFMYIEDMDVADNKLGDSAGNAIAMSRYMNQKMNNNVALQDSQGERESVQPISAQEATLGSLRRQGIQRTNINRWYRGRSKLLKEMFRRITVSDVQYTDAVDGYEARKAFFEECEDLGIPRDAISLDHCNVRAYRSIGHGSMAAEDLATKEIVGYALAGVMDDQTKVQSALHNRVAAVADWQTAEDFFPLKDITSDQIENTLISLMLNDLREGTAVAVEQKQRHAKHAVAIINMLDQEIERLIEDPVALLSIMSPSMAKLADHMDFMSRMPQYARALNEIKPKFKELLETFNNVRQKAISILDEQQRQALEERQRIEELLANQPDADVLKVITDAQNKQLDVQLSSAARMQTVANRHAERLMKIDLDAQADSRERLLNAANETPRPTTRPQVPQAS